MILVGTVIHEGFCGGAFGRHSEAYQCKRVEAIGADWVVLRGLDTAQPFMFEGSAERLEEYVAPAHYCPHQAGEVG